MNSELRKQFEELLLDFEAKTILSHDYSKQYKLPENFITKDDFYKAERDAVRAYNAILEFFDELVEKGEES